MEKRRAELGFLHIGSGVQRLPERKQIVVLDSPIGRASLNSRRQAADTW
ncbi:hypothetical protein [Streptomyces hoynatensis]|nr:hypothetical protein [Streptomyces hoynatensis]